MQVSILNFKHFNMLKEVDDVVDHLVSLLPEGKWTQDNGQDIHLIMTGGEPLLAWQRLYIELFEHPRMQDLKNVTFETNSTQLLHDNFRDYLNNHERITWTFSCSPKLSVSGEPWDTAIKPDVVANYYGVQNSDLYLKFVVADRTDIDEAGRAVDEYRQAGIECPVYLMPLGGRSEEYNLNVQEVANICMEKDGGLRRDSTSAYSEMPGELNKITEEKRRVEKAMKAPIDQDKIRRAGW